MEEKKKARERLKEGVLELVGSIGRQDSEQRLQ